MIAVENIQCVYTCWCEWYKRKKWSKENSGNNRRMRTCAREKDKREWVGEKGGAERWRRTRKEPREVIRYISRMRHFRCLYLCILNKWFQVWDLKCEEWWNTSLVSDGADCVDDKTLKSWSPHAFWRSRAQYYIPIPPSLTQYINFLNAMSVQDVGDNASSQIPFLYCLWIAMDSWRDFLLQSPQFGI